MRLFWEDCSLLLTLFLYDSSIHHKITKSPIAEKYSLKSSWILIRQLLLLRIPSTHPLHPPISCKNNNGTPLPHLNLFKPCWTRGWSVCRESCSCVFKKPTSIAGGIFFPFFSSKDYILRSSRDNVYVSSVASPPLLNIVWFFFSCLAYFMISDPICFLSCLAFFFFCECNRKYCRFCFSLSEEAA